MVRINITVTARHMYILVTLGAIMIGILAVTAYNSGGPASVVGHSPDELVVNGSSIVDDTISAADIDAVSLASECSSITGSGELCDGSDRGTYSLSERSIQTNSGSVSAVSQCGGGFNILSGGCVCGSGIAVIASRPATVGEASNNNGWYCECDSGTATAHSICTTAS